jgi:GntR family phosphonate transport system transcriptional regulator
VRARVRAARDSRLNCKWTGLADSLRRQLDDGTLQPGDRPSIGQLSPELGISRKTIARALRALEDEGRLHRQPGTGYIVVQHAART